MIRGFVLMIRPNSVARLYASRGTISTTACSMQQPKFFSSARRRVRRNQDQPESEKAYNQSYKQHQSSSSSSSSSLTPPTPLLYILSAYFAAINVGAAGLFWYDKHQATTRGWRVPERQLQLTALLGGWIGGMWAMEKFRHKTTKKAFREPYFACVAGNALIMAGVAGCWMALPAFRSRLIGLARF